jgi:hypothetical protein
VRTNIIAADADWAARYARAVLDTLPKDAVLFVNGDTDLPPIGYLHMVEGVRPDITLYHTRGLILGNRLFHPLRTTEEQMNAALTEFIRAQAAPVLFTENFGMPLRADHWLHLEVAKTAADRDGVAEELTPPALRFLEESVLADSRSSNAWVAHLQGELRRRYGVYLGRRLPRGQQPSEADRRRLAALAQTYEGALGLAEGTMANPNGYAAGVVGDLLARAQDLMPSDVRKVYRAKYFYLRGALRLDLGDRAGAVGDFEIAISLWPAAANQAIKPLQALYREAGNEAGWKAVEERVKRRR